MDGHMGQGSAIPAAKLLRGDLVRRDATSFRQAIRESILSGRKVGNRLSLPAIMEHINQADEYRRLEELYAEMGDEQIEAMSGQMEDLTDIAQQVLRAEMSR